MSPHDLYTQDDDTVLWNRTALTSTAIPGKLTHNGTDGRSYGGDPGLVHIPDHHREDVGKAIADELTALMRMVGTLGVGHEPEPYEGTKPLCPGCYMIALFDAAVELAKREGQDVRELGYSMAKLFAKLAKDGEYRATEEMIVVSIPEQLATELVASSN